MTRWTPAEDQKLRELWREGHSPSVMEGVFERDACGIGNRAFKIGLGRFRDNPAAIKFQPEQIVLDRAPDRTPCGRCGVRADLGCKHQVAA